MVENITLSDVKRALQDGRFRDKLPLELQNEVVKFLQNPGCSCNIPLYRKIIKNHQKNLLEYYPNKTGIDEHQELPKNNWNVINCKVDELQRKLKELPPGRKQLAMSRFEDQITVVVNELDG